MLEDKILIWKVKRGDRGSLCRIYEKYENDLLTLAVNLLGDVAAAEDVVHDVFVKFTRSIDKFHLTGSLKSYLATCVANQARDKFRERKRHKVVGLNEAVQVESGEVNPIDKVIRGEQLEKLAQVLTLLSYEQREVIIMHLQGGLTFKQIANGYDSSINTVKSRYRYGLDKLKSLMNSEAEK